MLFKEVDGRRGGVARIVPAREGNDENGTLRGSALVPVQVLKLRPAALLCHGLTLPQPVTSATADQTGSPHGQHTPLRPRFGKYAAQVSEDDVRILEVTAVDDELLAAFELLIPQLSSSNPPPPASELQAIIDDPDSVLYIARDDRDGGRIVGSLTLAMYRIPTGLKAWIDDVVVDSEVRGRGVGRKLNVVALDKARQAGAKSVDLTSRPHREAANRLYQRLGFEKRETNVYRYKLGSPEA